MDSSLQQKERSNFSGRNVVLVFSLSVVFFLLGYWVGSQGEITLGRIGKSESLRLVGNMYLGDPRLDKPEYTYHGFDQVTILIKD